MWLIAIHEWHLKSMMIGDVSQSTLIQEYGIIGGIATQALHYERLNTTLSHLTGLKCAENAHYYYTTVVGRI